jgi:hypothetical protein
MRLLAEQIVSLQGYGVLGATVKIGATTLKCNSYMQLGGEPPGHISQPQLPEVICPSSLQPESKGFIHKNSSPYCIA